MGRVGSQREHDAMARIKLLPRIVVSIAIHVKIAVTITRR